MIVNPLTRQILVTNHPGHPDQKVHDPTKGRSLETVDSFGRLGQGKMGKAGYILPSGELVDVSEHARGEEGVHLGLKKMMDNPEEFGLDQEDVDAYQEDDRKYGWSDRMEGVLKKLYSKGNIRLRQAWDEVAIEIDPETTPLSRVRELIESGKIPEKGKFSIDDHMAEPIVSGVTYSDLLRSRDWRELKRRKESFR